MRLLSARVVFQGVVVAALLPVFVPACRAQFNADYQTNIISGVASNWLGSYFVGSNTFADALLIDSGGKLTVRVVPIKYFALGYETVSSNNRIVVQGNGSALIISNASSMSPGLLMTVGHNGAGNSLVISNGGKVVSDLGFGEFVGYLTASSNNSVLVTGPDSVWSNRSLIVGYAGTGNSLVISNGGQVISARGSGGIGSWSSGSNNFVRVVDGGLWQCARYLDIGDPGPGNTLIINGGSVFVGLDLRIGPASTCDNLVRLDSESLLVGGTLTIESGTLLQTGGFLQIGKLVMYGSCSRFIRTGGTQTIGSVQLDPAFDADGDGVPNGYEQSHALDPFNPADANADSDGDGLSNLQEFQAGTDPTNSVSAFRILSVALTNEDLLISWMAGGGRTNIVQSVIDLTGSYTNVSTNIVLTGSGDVTTNYLDTGAATNAANRFYRIRLVP